MVLCLPGCPRFAYLELHNATGDEIEFSISGDPASRVKPGASARVRAGARELDIGVSGRSCRYTMKIPHDGANGPYFDGTLRVRLDPDRALTALPSKRRPRGVAGAEPAQPLGFPLRTLQPDCWQGPSAGE